MSDRRRCAQLAAWGSAWLQGEVAFDDVLEAISGTDRHLGGTGFAVVDLHPVGSALAEWKRLGTASLRLVLPVPGDVRGLTGPAEFRDAALSAGEAVYGLEFGLTVLPGRETPSSAASEIRWNRGPVTVPVSDPISLADAEHDLTESIRETASLLGQRGATSWLTDIASALSDARRAGERLHLPPAHPPRAVRLLAQAERLAAVLVVVDGDQTGEITAAGAAEKGRVLTPLRLAVRRALVAGYNAADEMAAN